MMPTWSRLCSAFAILIVAMTLSACGNSADPAGPVSAKITRQSLQLLTPAEVQAQPKDTPFRALLEWWRLSQYRDAAGSVRYFTATARRSAGGLGPGFGSVVYNDFGPWLQHVKPRLLRTEQNGPTTTLFLELTIREVLSPSVVRERKEFVGIPMTRVHGRWLIADATFYLENARRVQAQRTQGSKQ
jgi:hypothetical protein